MRTRTARATATIAGLLAGVALGPVAAQTAVPPIDRAQVPSRGSATSDGPAPAASSPAQPEFRDADGNPLPPEVQAQLRERLKNDPNFAKPPVPASGNPQAGPAGANGGAGGTGDVVVRALRSRGSVLGDIPPERTLTPADIRAYGADTVDELIGALGAQVRSGRGRNDDGPVVLLNGKRVASYAEIARLPPEAIERMEVLPEEVALKYGYRADQKVVNVVAFERYTATVGNLSLNGPTDGGRTGGGVTGSYLLLRDDIRYNLDVEHSRAGKLKESERDVAQVGGDPNLGRFRTLVPSTERSVVNATVAKNILSDVSATLNGRYEAVGSQALLGRSPGGALVRDLDTGTTHLGTSLTGRIDRWQWSFTGNYDRIVTETRTDAASGGARDEARAVNALAGADLLLAGPVLELPAGPMSASLRAGVDLRDFTARSRVAGVEQASDLGRNRGTVQANLDLPITGASAPVIGQLTISGNAAVERLSDAGTLRTLGYGVSWAPIEAVNLLASVTDEGGAPTVEQLGGPLVVTPASRTFDFARGETVDITRVFGSNPALRPDDRRVVSLGLSVRPIPRTDLTVTVNYVDTRIDDTIATFPIPTIQVEAAFPERFGRDVTGRLRRLDATPLNFARSRQRQLRWGIALARPFGEQPPSIPGGITRYFPSAAEAQRRMPSGPNTVVRRISPDSPEYRLYENRNSRITFSLQHTLRLQDEVLLRPGFPVLDLLDGGALDARGGRPRHEVEVQAGIFRKGLGARLTANWQSGTSVDALAAGAGQTGALDFGSLATVNLSMFANVNSYLGVANVPDWAKGIRLTLGINNLFNQRPDVRDAAGRTPLNYQAAYLNPFGRTVNLGLRKLF